MRIVIEPEKLKSAVVSDVHKRFMKRMDEMVSRAYAKYESEKSELSERHSAR